MTEPDAAPSARRDELLETAYRYVVSRGRAELSLRPLASAIGSSPRVLLYLFGSKDGLIHALLARARTDELAALTSAGLAGEGDARPGEGGRGEGGRGGTGQRGGDQGGAEAAAAGRLAVVAAEIWSWLADPGHRGLLTLWVDGYARSLAEPEGPWAGFAAATVADWLAVLAAAQPAPRRDTTAGLAERTLVLAVLRGGLLDLLATGETERITAAVRFQLATLPRTGAPG